MNRLFANYILVSFFFLLSACSSEPDASISAEVLSKRIQENNAPLILDVRTKKEFDAGHLVGAMHIPLQQLNTRIKELEAYQTKELIVYCHSGKRAGKAEGLLKEAGFQQVVDLSGHYQGWKQAGLPLQK